MVNIRARSLACRMSICEWASRPGDVALTSQCLLSVGWVNTIRYTLSSWSGNEIKFKPATFYLEVVSLLTTSD